MYSTEKYRREIHCICDWKKTVLVFARQSWQTNQKGALTGIQSLLPTFPLIYGLAEGLLYLWNGWHSAPNISSPWYEFALAFGLASFTAQCAQLRRLDCKTPSFVSTSTMRHNRIHLRGSYAHTEWKIVLSVKFGFMTLAFNWRWGDLETIKTVNHISLNLDNTPGHSAVHSHDFMRFHKDMGRAI